MGTPEADKQAKHLRGKRPRQSTETAPQTTKQIQSKKKHRRVEEAGEHSKEGDDQTRRRVGGPPSERSKFEELHQRKLMEENSQDDTRTDSDMQEREGSTSEDSEGGEPATQTSTDELHGQEGMTTKYHEKGSIEEAGESESEMKEHMKEEGNFASVAVV